MPPLYASVQAGAPQSQNLKRVDIIVGAVREAARSCVATSRPQQQAVTMLLASRSCARCRPRA